MAYSVVFYLLSIHVFVFISANSQGNTDKNLLEMISNLQKRVIKLEKIHIEDEKDIKALKQDNHKLHQELETYKKNQSQIVEQLKNMTECSFHDTKICETGLGDHRSGNESTVLGESSFKDRKTARRSNFARSTVAVVAFYAILNHNIDDPFVSEVIHFDNVITNVGGYYDANTGAFRCGVPGLYYFSWTVQVGDMECMQTDLLHNGQEVGYQAACTNDISETGTSSAILQLNVNDSVWVRVRITRPGADINSEFTSFSGFLI